jgi:hypothetical protein
VTTRRRSQETKVLTGYRLYVGIILTALSFTTTVVAVFAKRTFDMINESHQRSLQSVSDIQRLKEDMKELKATVEQHSKEIQNRTYENGVIFQSLEEIRKPK